MDKLLQLLNNTVILAIGNFSSKFLTLLLVPLYTAYLTTAEYGIYDIVYSTVGLLASLLTLNIADAALRFSLEDGADRSKIIRACLCITLASDLVVLLAQLIPGAPWNSVEGIGWLAPLYASSSLYQLMLMYSRGTEHMVDVAVAGLIGTATTLGLCVLLLVAFPHGLEGFFAANTLGLLLPAAYLAFRRRGDIFGAAREGGESVTLREMVRYSLPLSLTVVGWWLVNVSDRYVVMAICGASANGLYSVAYKIPAVLSVAQGVFLQAWQVSAIKGYDPRDADGFLRRAFGTAEGAFALLCSLMMPLAPLLARLLFSDEFYEAWRYVPFLLVYTVANASAGLFGPLLLAVRDTRPMMVSTVLGGILNMALGVPLVFLLGVQGAALSSVAAGLAGWAWRARAVRRNMEVGFRPGRSLAAFGALAAQAAAMAAQPPVGVCAAVQALGLGAVLFLYRDALKGIASTVIRRFEG